MPDVQATIHSPQTKKEPALSKTELWLSLDPTIAQRASKITEIFRKQYKNGDFDPSSLVYAIAPGRAEILGNHTDYNQGYTISANITQTLLVVGEKRSDGIVRILSCGRDKTYHEFIIGNIDELEVQKSPVDSENSWTNYVKGVVWSFVKEGLPVSGFQAVIESTVPQAGGTSSSAALETAISRLICELNGLQVDAEKQVQLCKRAENEYVGVPCGYLDQGTVGLADGWLVMSYRPVDGKPFTYSTVPMNLAKLGYQLIVGYDTNSKHALVDGKYALRQKICFDSIPILQQLLPGKSIQSLRDVSTEDFQHVKEEFRKRTSEQATNFVTHIVNEDERVLLGQKVIEGKDIQTFGALLTASGESAINLYELDEESPELRFVYETVKNHQKQWGVAGIRNMGGGFNSTTLALVQTDKVTDYKQSLQSLYQQQFNSTYHFLEFVPSPSSGILELAK